MISENEIVRYNPSKEEGLDEEAVSKRKEDKLTNKTTKTVYKSVLSIVLDNVFSFYNIVLYLVAIIAIALKQYSSLFFLIVVIINIGLGLYSDIRVRVAVEKSNPFKGARINVIRNSFKQETFVEDLVLDDIVEIQKNTQIPADLMIIEGSFIVDESRISGKSVNTIKKVGDLLLCGSYIVSGNGYGRVDSVRNSELETLKISANKTNRPDSNITKVLKNLFGITGVAALLIGITMLIGLSVNNQLNNNLIAPVSSTILAMIPYGFALLTTFALFITALGLRKKEILVQDIYSLGAFSNCDAVCFDKTGTITNNKMQVVKVVPYASNSETTLTGLLNDFVNSLEESNSDISAMKEYFNHPVNSSFTDKLECDGANKYSAITFQSGSTYLLGEVESLNLINKQGVLNRIEEYVANGYKVVVLAKAKTGIKNNEVNSECEALGFVLLKEQLRDGIKETIKWLKENKKKVYVISGDDLNIVKAIAKEVDVDNCISLKDTSLSNIKDFITKYRVFADASAEQKEEIIRAIKESGQQVAMIGGGINDVLALKRANCSIAMQDGHKASRNIAQVVLSNSSFVNLLGASKECDATVNNLHKGATMFLTQAMVGIVLSLVFLIGGVIAKNGYITYPLVNNALYVWSGICFAISSLLLVFEPNDKKEKDRLLISAFKKSIGGASAAIIGIIVIFGLYHLQKHNVMYTGIYLDESAVAMSTILFMLVMIFVLIKISLPFNKYKAIVVAITVILLGTVFLMSYINAPTTGLLNFNLETLNPVNYLETLIVSTIVIALYIVISYIVEVFQGQHIDNSQDKKQKKKDNEADITVETYEAKIEEKK